MAAKKGSTRSKTNKRTTTNKAQVVRAVVLIFLIILALSNFGLLGIMGHGIKWLFFGIFGVMDYILPFYCGAHIIWRMVDRSPSGEIRKRVGLGYVLMALIDGFVQRVLNVPDIYASTPGDIFLNSAVKKEGGGFIGGVIDKALSPTLLAGTIIILLGLMALCVITIIDSDVLFSKEKEKHPTEAQLKREREAERRYREDQRLQREDMRRHRNLERESKLQAREERREWERQRAHEREIRRLEREKELMRHRQEMEAISGTISKDPYQHYSDDTFEDTDFTDLTRSRNKVRGVGDFSIDGSGTQKSDPGLQTDYGTGAENRSIRHRRRGSTQHEDGIIYRSEDDPVISPAPSFEPDETAIQEEAVPDMSAYDSIGLPDDETDRLEIEERRRQRREERERRMAERRGETRPGKRQEAQPVTRREAKPKTKPVPEKPALRETPEEAINNINKDYEFPPLALLNRGSARSSSSRDENRRTAALLLQTLETFGVNAEITDISCGPAVTRFEIQPPIGTRVSKIVSLSDEIKLNLAAEDIRIEAPIPGKAAIGIEIPNKNPSSVTLYELLESDTFRQSKSLVSFAVGEDITGNTVVADIAKMPHVLIAGQTGSGKSVCINSLIMSVLYKARPDQVKMIMVDPKVVELSAYNGIPHLLFPVVTDPRKASGVLNWTVAEMEARYKRFEECGVKNIAGYNEAVSAGHVPEAIPMPQLLVIIDELADLMMVAKGDVETAICRLAQLARAAGIHLIIATQRPSVNVITGLIKANVPSKIAFAVASGVDSRTILDMNGAEKLLGKGDMLFFPTGMAKPKRVQGAFVSDEEVANVVGFLRERNDQASEENEHETDEDVADPSSGGSSGGTLMDISNAFAEPSDDDRDELFEPAARFVIEKQRGSIGMLQRNFKIGFNRAGRIMDQLAEAGVVGPDIGTKPRQVLMTEEDLEGIL